MQKGEIGPFYYITQEINQNGLSILKVRPESVKLGGKHWEKLFVTGLEMVSQICHR